MNRGIVVLGLILCGLFLAAAHKPARNNATEPGHRVCGQQMYEEYLRNKFPNMDWSHDHFESIMSKLINAKQARGVAAANDTRVKTIRTLVHVIHNGEAIGSGSNLPESRISSQIDVLNKDYAGETGDDHAINTHIKFELAGINRVNRREHGWSSPPFDIDFVEEVVKPATIKAPDSLFNLWSIPMGGGLLGYAAFPTASGLEGLDYGDTTAQNDGVVITDTAFGVTNEGAYGLGRTASHEVGHWLGLRHIWGDGGCSATDYVADTPPAPGPTWGCPKNNRPQCSGFPPAMIENYMDYSDDACLTRFTAGQLVRMETVLERSPRRKGTVV